MQAVWSDGYFSQCPYDIGYYREQSPAYQRFCLLLQGYDVPEGENFCELGFGQGLTVNMHAASIPGNWYGTDFNPQQVTFARHMAQNCGNNARLYDEAFADFCHRTDLPEFDYISLHGIWSWVSQENRGHMRHLMDKRLKNGGVVYVSYNAQPGSMQRAPVRNLMYLYDAYEGKGQSQARATEGLNFVRELVGKQPAFLGPNPTTINAIDTLKGLNSVYLAHEYLNDIWDNLHFTEVAEYLAEIRLNFAAAAQPQLNVEQLGYTTEAIEFLRKIESPLLREQIRDYFSNTAFRRDLYIRGGMKLHSKAQSERIMDTRIVLCAPPEMVDYSVEVGMGKVNLTVESHRPIVEHLAQDNYRPKTIREICTAVPQIRPGQIIAAIATLCGTGWLSPCQSEALARAAEPQTRRLNDFLMKRSKLETDIEFLASPLIGSGLSLTRLNMLFLHFRNSPNAPKTVLDLLRGQGENLINNGRDITDPAEEQQLMDTAYAEYKERLPIYKALMLL